MPSARRGLDAVLALVWLVISLGVLQDYLSGGNRWKHGDWLINTAGGPVRRGPFGSAVLSVGDLLGISPLLVVCVLQVVILAVLFLAFRALVDRAGPVRLQAMLWLSPAFFTVLWVVEPQGAVRKELLAFAGLSLLALGAVSGRLIVLWLGVLVYCISTIAHEGMVLFGPVFIGILVLSGLFRSAPWQALSATLIAIGVSGAALFYALVHARVEDPNLVCAPLLERGLDPEICAGAISWLAHDAGVGVAAVAERLTGASVVGFLLGALAAFAPFGYLVSVGTRPRLGLVILLGAVLPILPLFPVASDWGRWLSLQVFSMSVLLSCAMASGRFPLRAVPSRGLVVGAVGMALLVSPNHAIGLSGLAVKITRAVLPPGV